MDTQDTIIYAIVAIIISIQLFFFLKNFKKIMAYKNIISGNDKLSVIELSIDEDEITKLNPEELIENESLYEDKQESEPEVYKSESEPNASHIEYEDLIEDEEETDEYYEDEEDDEEDGSLNLFS